MVRQQARAQDYTGKQREAAAKERDEQAKRASEISMATAEAEAAERAEVVDLSEPNRPVEVETGPVEVEAATRRVTMNTTLENTTFGRNEYGPNTLTLEEGRTYILPKAHADHLDRQGFVHH